VSTSTGLQSRKSLCADSKKAPDPGKSGASKLLVRVLQDEKKGIGGHAEQLGGSSWGGISIRLFIYPEYALSPSKKGACEALSIEQRGGGLSTQRGERSPRRPLLGEKGARFYFAARRKERTLVR